MCSIKRYIIFLCFLLPANHLGAQVNITGCWEGDLGWDQFLQLNVTQKGDRLCGYTWDYVKGEKSSYCKAYFEGSYNKKHKEWILYGTDFVQNSGGHFLMRVRLSHRYVAGYDVLEGVSSIKSLVLTLLTGGAMDSVYLKKVSDKPKELPEKMYDCFPEEKKPKDTIVAAEPKPVIPKTDSILPIVPPVIIKKDTVAAIPPPVIIPNDSITIPKQLVERKNTEQSHIEVHVDSITLNVYDNAIVDGDTISVFYNGKLLLSHQRLSEKPIVINLKLDKSQTRHEIILFAENLGSIPPNTALIVIHAGDKRYELFSSASLEENAVLVFDYIPKKE